jgi:acyl-CoA dehydrogenase
VAAAGAAADAAAQACSLPEIPMSEIAIAKVRGGEAAGAGAAIAHQVHGAMGFTYEHSLHHSTRRLWSWREEFGNEAAWATRLGRMVAARGADELWPFITAGS